MLNPKRNPDEVFAELKAFCEAHPELKVRVRRFDFCQRSVLIERLHFGEPINEKWFDMRLIKSVEKYYDYMKINYYPTICSRLYSYKI